MATSIADSFVFVPREHASLQDDYEPGSKATYAHDWSSTKLTAHGRHFLDQHGRVCMLRGVNLSGSSKTPVNRDHSVFPANAELATFVGPHEHLSRLRRWGFSFIRFLVTWEAVEHAGPGRYDTEYLKYIRALLSLFPKYGMKAFVSMHQDVWSRYSGGSGAPAWTLEAVGFDLDLLDETHAAWLIGVKGGGHTEAERGIWPCGYQKLSAATMATCFWAGNTFAPKLRVDNGKGEKVSIQDYLQTAFLDMFDLEGVLGFELMNEPHRGYAELNKSLYEFDYNTDLHLSYVPTAFESFQLGAGYPTHVHQWVRSFPMPTSRGSTTLLNPKGVKVWRPDGPTGGECLWRLHGIWDYDTTKNKAVILRENYFKQNPETGAKIDWYSDFYYPFVQKWADRVRKITSPDKLVFLEPIPNEFCPRSWTPDKRPANMVYAPHWYDLKGLFDKAFGNFTVNVQGLSRGMFLLKAFYWGHLGARDNFALQLRNIVEEGYKSLGETPVIIGECGIPMDMNRREAFSTDDFTWQSRMMDAMITGLDRALVGFTLWNYNPFNTDIEGDDWNGENFSWFSRHRALPSSLLSYEQTAVTLDNGGRILNAVVRPYPAKVAGIPLSFDYEMTTWDFHLQVDAAGSIEEWPAEVHNPPLVGHPTITAAETEIFVPSLISAGRRIIVEGLKEDIEFYHDESRQTLFVVQRNMEPACTHSVTVRFDPPLQPEFPLENWTSAFGMRFIAIIVLLFSILIYSLTT
ncbi:glycoside hydrolase family 5 protein [Flagelloscypha sp. PMI_526]|nr:glycoside hydrolase family 5 protein [Flagelloscypha sp. PMI_526]